MENGKPPLWLLPRPLAEVGGGKSNAQGGWDKTKTVRTQLSIPRAKTARSKKASYGNYRTFKQLSFLYTLQRQTQRPCLVRRKIWLSKSN